MMARAVKSPATVAVGDLVEWTSADGTAIRGVVSYVGAMNAHVDTDTGSRMVALSLLRKTEAPKVGAIVHFLADGEITRGTIQGPAPHWVVGNASGYWTVDTTDRRFYVHTDGFLPAPAATVVCPDCEGKPVAGLGFFGWLRCSACGSTNA